MNNINEFKNFRKLPEANFLLDCVQARMSSVSKTINSEGKVEKMDIFQEDDIYRAMFMTLSDVKCHLYEEDWVSDLPKTMVMYSGLIVLGTCHHLLLGQALLEKGRDYTLQDNGIVYDRPRIADRIYELYLHETKIYHNFLERMLNR